MQCKELNVDSWTLRPVELNPDAFIPLVHCVWVGVNAEVKHRCRPNNRSLVHQHEQNLTVLHDERYPSGNCVVNCLLPANSTTSNQTFQPRFLDHPCIDPIQELDL